MKIKHTIVAAILLLIGASSYAQGFKKDANAVRFKDVKITILTPTMFSIQKGSNHKFDAVKTDLGITNTTFLKVPFSVNKDGSIYRIATAAVEIVYNPDKTLDNGGITVAMNGTALIDALGTEDTQNLGGVIGALDNCDGDKSYAEQNDITSSWRYNHNPDDGILSRRGYVVLKHTPDHLNQYKAGEAYNELYVLCYGSEYRKAMSDFFSLAGSVPMLPKWSLGFIYSRWKDYNDQDYKNIVSHFREEKIPIDAIILDMCWHVDHWYGYKYDMINFPDMRAFHRWTDSVHVKTGFNHHSGCIYMYDPDIHKYCKAAGLDYESSIADGPSFEPHIKVLQYDTHNERHFKAFYDIYLTRMINDGFDFHWVDGANSIYTSNLYSKYLSDGTGKRPFVLNRQHSHTLCNHRYPAGFSGDSYATWATMRYTVENTLKGGNNGVYWSHDIGGYMPQGEDGYLPGGEMLARWVQLGAFSPLLRFHAKKDVFWHPPVRNEGDWDGGSRLPWEWGKTVLGSIRSSMQLRSSLMPYIYTLSADAHETGVPLCRGMYLDWPLDDEAYKLDQYMFGEFFLVAPLMTPSGYGQRGETERTLWLPEGVWYDYFTGEKINGGKQLSRANDINTFPLFVKEGALIPSTVYQEYASMPLDTLILNAYTPIAANKTTFDLYEDEGENFDYERGQSRRTALSYEYSPLSGQKITVNTPRGDYKGSVASRTYIVKIYHGNKPQSVTVNGTATSKWDWNAKNGILTVDAGTQNVTKTLIVEAK